MSDAEEPAVDPALGRDVEEAVEVVLDREPAADRESVRSALDLVAEDGAVTPGGVSAALGEAAQHVATPENRLELTGDALDSTREAAEPAADLDAVRSRLAAFEERYRDLEADLEDLLERLDGLVERGSRPGDVYDLARSIRDLKWDVRDVHGDVEELRTDLESFERWATDPGVRFDELDGDAGHVEELLEGLAETIEELEAPDATGDGDVDDPEDGTDLGLAWADAVLQRRVIGLLVTDLRAELSDLRTWAERTGESDAATRANEIEARIDDLRAREERLGERLETLARPAWRDRFGARIEAVEADLDSFDPPVQWGPLQVLLEEHRSTLAEEG